jgi:L-fuculose-phosphate aldolase
MITDDLERLVEDFTEVCRRVAAKGFVSATDGNVSVRLLNGNILATPTAINKGVIKVGDLVEITLAGVQVAGSRKPSSEMDMHLFIYESRPDVGAVVHCHPIYATAFATARIALSQCLFPEVIVGLGAVPLAPYATPSTAEVRGSIAPYVRSADAILLSNHGVVTYGKDVWDAYFKMEKVEHAAHIQYLARTLGGEKLLTSEEVLKLRAISTTSYGKDFSWRPACEVAPGPEEIKLTNEEIRTIVDEVKKRLNVSEK